MDYPPRLLSDYALSREEQWFGISERRWTCNRAVGYATFAQCNSSTSHQHGGDVVRTATVERGEDQVLDAFLCG